MERVSPLDLEQVVLSGSENGYVYAWELVEGTLLQKLDHSENDRGSGGILGGASSLTVHSLSYHPEKCELLTAARGKVYVWRDKKEEDE